MQSSTESERRSGDRNDASPTPVFLTVDVEMWPPSWDAPPEAFVDAFKRYLLGVGARRDFGLPFQLKVLKEHRIPAVWFVEPLFAAVLGKQALADVVGIILEADGDIQLHVHPEWIGRAGPASLPGRPVTRMYDLSLDRQLDVIRVALEWLNEAGAPAITAFRAGSFSADPTTLEAVRQAGLLYDFSVNAAAAATAPSLLQRVADEGTNLDGVLEIPLTTYRDGFGRLRGLQVGSSGASEASDVMKQARSGGHPAVVILSHSAELLNSARSKVDAIARRRFERLCFQLAEGREHVATDVRQFDGFDSLKVEGHRNLPTLRSSHTSTLVRYSEQLVRRLL